MSDKTESVTPENTTSALSHLAFCALESLGVAHQDGITGTSTLKNLFFRHTDAVPASEADASDVSAAILSRRHTMGLTPRTAILTT